MGAIIAATSGNLFGLVLLAMLSFAMTGCASLTREPADLSFSLPAHETSQTALGAIAQQALGQAAGSPSATHLMPTGLESLAARLSLIENAQRSLDLQYYIWRPDSSGTSLAIALWKAADRGVRVRLLLDDWGTRPSEMALSQLSQHPNMEVRLFNPIPLRWPASLGLLLNFKQSNRRMHNKALVADNQLAIVGGRNIGNEYFQKRDELAFSDLDVMLVGAVVNQISSGFDDYWNSEHAMPVPRSTAAPQPFDHLLADELMRETKGLKFDERLAHAALKWHGSEIAALQDRASKVGGTDSPQDHVHLGRQISRLSGDLTKDLLIVSPYFVPGPGGLAQLCALTERGVEVRVVTNSLAATDVPAVHAGYERYRKPLLQCGVRLFETRADANTHSRGADNLRGKSSGSSRVSLHAKIMVMDRAKVFVGSMNIDPRSLLTNTENGVLIDNPDLAGVLDRGITSEMVNAAYELHLDGGAIRWSRQTPSGRETYSREPQADGWLLFKKNFFSIFAIESLL